LCGSYGEGTFAIFSPDSPTFCTLVPSAAGTPGNTVTLMAGPSVKPGATRSNRLTFQFGAKDSDPMKLLARAQAEFGKQHPITLDWPDRRAIACLHPSSSHLGTFGENAQPGNPRGWILGEPAFDVNTPQGEADFKKRMLAFASRSAKICNEMDAQGVIVWCLEGQEFPHTISYVGAPNQLGELAPEMDAIADEYFSIFKQAGLRTGITLRPQRLQINPDYPTKTKMRWYQEETGVDFIEELDQKIQYAMDRWGCTIFYIDTNIIEQRDGRKVWEIMPAAWFADLAQRHQDVLIIPEHETFDYWQSTAPLTQISGTPQKTRLAWPSAFSVNLLQNTDLSKPEEYEAAKASVAAGDILLFPGWYDAPVNERIRKIYTEAVHKAPAP
jgi:hypothetical protein